MYFAIISRTELLSLSRNNYLPAKSGKPSLPTEEGTITICWELEPEGFPNQIIVPRGDLDNFFAWASTYLAHLVPISSIARVTDQAVNKPAHQTNFVKRFSSMANLLAVYLVRAETVIACDYRIPPRQAGLTPFLSTYSWTELQRNCFKRPKVDHISLCEKWTEARDTLGARKVNYFPKEVEHVWQILDGKSIPSRESSKVSDVFNDFVEGLSQEGKLDYLVETLDSSLLRLKAGTIESRVVNFRELCTGFDKRLDPDLSSLLKGMGLSLISQGSFRHFKMLQHEGPQQDIRPILWYAVFEALLFGGKGSDPIRDIVDYRLLQSASKAMDYKSSTDCDISLDELRVAARPIRAAKDLFVDFRAAILVELSPGINVSIRTQSDPF